MQDHTEDTQIELGDAELLSYSSTQQDNKINNKKKKQKQKFNRTSQKAKTQETPGNTLETTCSLPKHYFMKWTNFSSYYNLLFQSSSLLYCISVIYSKSVIGRPGRLQRGVVRVCSYTAVSLRLE